MEMNKENSNVDRGDELSKNLPPGEEIIHENQPAFKDVMPIHMVKLEKTAWDRIVEGLDILSSIAMVILTVFLAIFAFKQWNAAEKQADAANKQVEAANEQIKVAKAQNDLVSKQADAANKQVEVANEQIKVAKAQNELIKNMNEESKISNLKMNPVNVTYYVGVSDDKNKIDMVFKNMSSRPTAILSIDFRTKEGSIFRTIGGSDGIKLPLNIGAWNAEKISFGLKKDDIERLEDVLVTDLDNKQISAKQRRHVHVKAEGLSMIVSAGSAQAHVAQNVRVTKNKTEQVLGNKLSIFVKSIESAHSSNGLVVNATFSAPGEKSAIFSSIKTGDCLSYAGYAVRLISVSSDSADFSVSDGKPCE